MLACVVSACSSDSKTPTTPTTTTTAPPTLTKPTADSPSDNVQLDNVRPTLSVVNGTSNQSGVKTYEFEISDNSSFASSTNAVSSPEVAEDSSGKTTFAVGQDLQPTTRYYWHARMVQGASKSDWSDTRSLKTRLVGYNKPGALYDPLVNSETVGNLGGSGNITWVPGQGIRMNDELAYVIYDLPQVFESGEMSVEVLGLAPGGAPGKARIFSILDRLGVASSSAKHSINVQYRGAGGAPDNCIAWKAVLGDNANSLEPNTDKRYQSVVILDPSTWYLWQVSWTPTSVRVIVKETGGAGSSVVYDYQVNASTNTTDWDPSAVYAFLGTNNASFTGFDGTRIGATFRNFWVGSTPRPATLGSAIAARR
jgi:hypothetical protein